MVWPVDDLVEMVRRFAAVAFHDPLSFVLVVAGVLLVGAAMAVFGYLSFGALVDLLTPEATGRPPERRA